jgi:hypothetical protein
MKSALAILLLLILLAPIATPMPILNTPQNPTTNHTRPQDSNITTLRFTMARIVTPATTDLVLTNDGYVSESGFAGPLNINFGYGILILVRLMVTNGTAAVEPLTSDPIILNPGDNITVLFGTYHYLIQLPQQEEPRGHLVGRFLGVTIEKHI